MLGHAAIRKALKPLGIGVATGEMCQNRVIFKQLMQAEAIDFCQIDSCRLGGVNEILAVILMAKKFGVPVCPHAGGVGLCEYVQHLSLIDYICVSASLEHRVVGVCRPSARAFRGPGGDEERPLHAAEAARLFHHHEAGEPRPLRVPERRGVAELKADAGGAS